MLGLILETERLTLRQFTLEDTGFILQLLNSPGWLRFIGDRNINTEEEAQNYLLSGPMKSYIDNGFGLGMVETKGDGIPIGMCGIVKRVNLEDPDIGFAFLPAFMGMGYAAEIAQATIIYAQMLLRLPRVLGITKPDNERSIRLLKKIGLNYKQLFNFPDQTGQLMLFGTD